jgi:nicotinate phosphoribosyltransferase
VAHKNDNVWVDVAKTSKSKSNLGGKKYAYRELENQLAKSEVVSSKKISSGRPLQVPLVIKGEIQQRFSGIQGVLLARIHHSTVITELPPTGFRLSKGEPVIPTVFI